MRKKSHILLARYIAKNTEDEELKKHRLSFYIGSILPDCKPSFVYKKQTGEDIKQSRDEILKILSKGEMRAFFILQMMFLVIILAVAVVMMYFVSRNQSVKNIFQKEEKYYTIDDAFNAKRKCIR